MAWRYLGPSFDIHAGGADLLFPHHENERAQSCCAFPGSSFARIWIHNGMLRVDGQKMSKSLGNFLTIRDVLARAPGEAIRLLLLRTHYRAPLDFTDHALDEARRELDRFYRALGPGAGRRRARPGGGGRAVRRHQHAAGDRRAAPAGRRGPGGRRRGGRRAAGRGRDARAARRRPRGLVPPGRGRDAVEAAIAERLAARKARDFARADAIRAGLAAKGIVLEDGPAGTTWRTT